MQAVESKDHESDSSPREDSTRLSSIRMQSWHLEVFTCTCVQRHHHASPLPISTNHVFIAMSWGFQLCGCHSELSIGDHRTRRYWFFLLLFFESKEEFNKFFSLSFLFMVIFDCGCDSIRVPARIGKKFRSTTILYFHHWVLQRMLCVSLLLFWYEQFLALLNLG